MSGTLLRFGAGMGVRVLLFTYGARFLCCLLSRMSRVRVTPGVLVTPQRLTNAALLTTLGGVVGPIVELTTPSPSKASCSPLGTPLPYSV